MNRRDELYRSVRAASEVVGIVVLTGMVVTSASLLFVFASDAKRDISQEIRVEDGVRTVNDLDGAATDVSMDTGGRERVDLGGIDPVRVHVVDAGYVGFQLNGSASGFDPTAPCSTQVPLSAVVVDVSSDTDLVYVAGGVWRVDESGVTVQTPPEISLEDGTLSFTTYNLQGEFGDDVTSVAEDDAASQRINDRVREELIASPACREALNRSVGSVSITTAFEPSGGPATATDAVSDVVPAFQRYLANELGAAPTTRDTPDGVAVDARLDGDVLGSAADGDRNQVVDFAGDGPGEVSGDAVGVDKGADNEYPVRMTLLATDVRNVTEVRRSVEVPVTNEVDLDRQQRYPDYEGARIDARRLVAGWDSISLPGDVRTVAPTYEATTTDLYRTTTTYEFQEVEADNAFQRSQQERVDAPEQDPLEVAFVLDESGSMETLVDDGSTRSDEAAEAASQFVNVMQTANAESPADARPHTAAVVGFGTIGWGCYDPDWGSCEQVRTLQPLTSNLDDVQGGIDDIGTYDQTPLWPGVDVGIDQLVRNGRSDTNKILVVLTDGDHNYPSEDPEVQRRIDEARANGITVYTVGTAGGEDSVDADDLQAIARETGGEYTFVSDSGDLESVFDRIVRDEITSNVTVREPAPAQTVRMKVLPEGEEFDGTVPADGVLTEYENREVVIAPAGDADRVSMADADAGVVRVHYADGNDTFFYLNGTDPTAEDASGAAAPASGDGDVVPDDPEPREQRVSTDVDQTVRITAYEEAPDPDAEPAHDLRIERGDAIVYLSVRTGDLRTTDERDRIAYVDEDGRTYYFDLTDRMIPEPGTANRWVDAGEIPAGIDARVLADGADAPVDAEVVAVDGQRVALRIPDDWEFREGPDDPSQFRLLAPTGNTYRVDLADPDAREELPDREDTVSWVPVADDERPSLEVIAAPTGDLPGDVETVVGDAAVTVTEDGTTYLLRAERGDLRATADGYRLETGGETYRFDADDVAALSETDATGWFPASNATVSMTVYDDAGSVPANASGYAVDVGGVVAVVDPDGDWDDVSVSGTTVRYERDGTDYRLDVGAGDLPPADERTDTETRIDRQVYSQPMTLEVTLGNETITTPWTDADSGLGSDLTRVGAGERDTVLTMRDGESLSFDASVYDCAPGDREPTGETLTVGGRTYNRTTCTAFVESSADPATVELYADGDTIPADADAAPWQEGLREALGSEYLDGDTVDVGDNQVIVVVEYDDASGASNYAVALVEVGRETPDVGSLLQIDVNEVEVDDDED